jgi:hypothetical protein
LKELGSDLLKRIGVRALDPGRRTRFAGARAAPMDLETLCDGIEDNMGALGPQATAGLVGLFRAVKKLGGFDLSRFDRIDGPGAGWCW